MTIDKPKVFDLSLRRKTVTDDPAMRLAHSLCKVVADNSEIMSPEEQIIAIELTARATLETMRQAFGEESLNAIIVDANRRGSQYTLNWPEHEHRNTVYQKHIQRPNAEVVPIRRKDGESNNGSEEPPDVG